VLGFFPPRQIALHRSLSPQIGDLGVFFLQLKPQSSLPFFPPPFSEYFAYECEYIPGHLRIGLCGGLQLVFHPPSCNISTPFLWECSLFLTRFTSYRIGGLLLVIFMSFTSPNPIVLVFSRFSIGSLPVFFSFSSGV